MLVILNFYLFSITGMFYQSQSTSAQTAFASLSTAAMSENVRTVASVPGSFSQKMVKGKAYWYYQVSDLVSGQTQIFLGPDTPQLSALVASHKVKPAVEQRLKQLARLAIASGCPYMVPNHAKIITRLADAGFFKAGGILVGTHVYMAYQNYLGVIWTSGAQTADLDFAHPGRKLSLALPAGIQMDTQGAIDSLEMGFVPVKSLTTYVKSDETDLQIDFVTTMHREGDKPIEIKALNVIMQPLKFMEFAMESPIQLTLLTRLGPVLVNAPPPEKYAVHKLLVYGERPQSQRVKADKDLEQAATLVDYLAAHDPEALKEAWDDLCSRGRGWRSRATEGLDALEEQYPGLDVSTLRQTPPVHGPRPAG